MLHSERVSLARAFLSDELPATDSLVPRTVPRLSALAQADYAIPVTPPPARISFFWGNDQSLSENSAGIINLFGGQITPICFGTSFQRSPVLPVGAFFYRFSQDSPVVDKGFIEIPRSQPEGGGGRLGTEQRYFRDLAAMTCHSCVSPPSRIGQEPPSISPYKD